MRSFPLFVTHWDASVPVYVPATVTKELKPYQIMGIRFLFDCLQKGEKGAILNHERGMNYPIQISAFFNAMRNIITPSTPVLIICSHQSLNLWQHHLKKYGPYQPTLLTANNCNEILESDSDRIILSTVDEPKLLKQLKCLNFFSIVVDELDVVVTKAIIKQLKSPFCIGLTYRNFLKQRDQKLLWSMLKWSNYNTAEKFDEFCLKDNESLENLREAYRSHRQRLTWTYSDRFEPPSAEEEAKLAEHFPEIEETSKKRPSRTQSKSKRKQGPKTQKLPSKKSKTSKAETEIDCKENSKGTNGDDLPRCHDDPQITITIDKNLDVVEKPQKNSSSEETIIYDEHDDNPILSSIMAGSLSPEASKVENQAHFSKEVIEEPLVEQNVANKENAEENDDDILISIIKNNPKDGATSFNDSDDDILTSIIKNGPKDSPKNTNESEDILMSIIKSDSEITTKNSDGSGDDALILVHKHIRNSSETNDNDEITNDLDNDSTKKVTCSTTSVYRTEILSLLNDDSE